MALYVPGLHKSSNKILTVAKATVADPVDTDWSLAGAAFLDSPIKAMSSTYNEASTYDFSGVSTADHTLDLTTDFDLIIEMKFGDNGNYFLAGSGSDDLLVRYNASTPGVISSVDTVSGKQSVSLTSFSAENMFRFVFSPNGDKFLFSDNSSNLYSRDVATPWDITTIASSGTSYTGIDVATHDIRGFSVSPDGLTIIAITVDGVILQIDLTTAWDVSTATGVTKSFDASTGGNLVAGSFFGGECDENGLNIMVEGNDGAADRYMDHWTFGTAYDVDTLSFVTGFQPAPSFGQDLHIVNNGTSLVMENGGEIVSQYAIGQEGGVLIATQTEDGRIAYHKFNPNTDSFDIENETVTTQASYPEGVSITFNGTSPEIAYAAIAGDGYERMNIYTRSGGTWSAAATEVGFKVATPAIPMGNGTSVPYYPYIEYGSIQLGSISILDSTRSPVDGGYHTSTLEVPELGPGDVNSNGVGYFPVAASNNLNVRTITASETFGTEETSVATSLDTLDMRGVVANPTSTFADYASNRMAYHPQSGHYILCHSDPSSEILYAFSFNEEGGITVHHSYNFFSVDGRACAIFVDPNTGTICTVAARSGYTEAIRNFNYSASGGFSDGASGYTGSADRHAACLMPNHDGSRSVVAVLGSDQTDGVGLRLGEVGDSWLSPAGTFEIVDASATSGIARGICQVNEGDNRVIFIYTDASYNLYACVATVANPLNAKGNAQFTVGTPVAIDSAGDARDACIIDMYETDQVLIVWRKGVSPHEIVYNAVTVSGTTITPNTTVNTGITDAAGAPMAITKGFHNQVYEIYYNRNNASAENLYKFGLRGLWSSLSLEGPSTVDSTIVENSNNIDVFSRTDANEIVFAHLDQNTNEYFAQKTQTWYKPAGITTYLPPHMLKTDAEDNLHLAYVKGGNITVKSHDGSSWGAEDTVAAATPGRMSFTAGTEEFHFVYDSGSGATYASKPLTSAFTPAASTHAHTADVASFTQVHDVSLNEATHAHSADQVGLSLTLQIGSATHTQTAETVTFTENVIYAVDPATHNHITDPASFTQQHSYTVQEAFHTHSADPPSFTQIHAYAVAESAHAQTVDQVTFDQTHILGIDPADHAHVADALTFAQVYAFTVDQATHAHLADQVQLGGPVEGDAATHAHTADALTFTQVHSLAVNPADHAQIADASSFTQVHAFATDPADHAHVADASSFAQVHSLAIGEAVHAHTADQVVVSESLPVAGDETTHAHTADALTFTQVHSVVVNPADHAHTAAQVTLAQTHVVSINGATHSHTADQGQAVPLMTLLPASDVDAGSWVASDDGPLFDAIDQAAEQIHSGALPDSDVCVIKLDPMADPEIDESHRVNYTISKPTGADQMDLAVALYDGVRQIAKWRHANITEAEASFTQNLTTAEAGLIVNYSDLRLHFIAGAAVNSDASFTNVSLLVSFDGADATTETADESLSSHPITFAGGAVIDTAQSKFGGSSLYCDGVNGTRISAPAGAPFDFGTGDFTIEGFARRSGTGTQILVSSWSNLENDQAFWLGWSASSMTFEVYDVDAGALDLVQRAWTFTQNTWVHFAISRQSGVLRMFSDGTQLGSDVAFAANIRTPVNDIWVGERIETSSFRYPFQGWVDELRITKGVARYTANFTPPSAPFSEV